MPQIETQEESSAVQAAYDTWVIEAGKSGRNTERDVWRAAWIAGRDWQRQQDAVAEADSLVRGGMRLLGCTHTVSCASADECGRR